MSAPTVAVLATSLALAGASALAGGSGVRSAARRRLADGTGPPRKRAGAVRGVVDVCRVAVLRYDAAWSRLVMRLSPMVPEWVQRAAARPATGRAALVAVVTAPLGTVPAAVGAGAVLVRPVVVGRRRRRDAAARTARTLPDVIELLRLGVSAGLTVRQCITVLGDRLPEPAGPVFAEINRRIGLGERLIDTLPMLVDRLGPVAQPLVRALVDTDRYGMPLEPALAQLAADARAVRRRRAEVAARRLPVLLLFPLVCCVLPAFGLLTVVPVLVSSLRSLGA